VKWKFPILRKLAAKYKEYGFLKFTLWFIFIWFGIKFVIFNLVGVLFFDMEPFPFLRKIFL